MADLITMLAASGGVERDPEFNNVSLLLHGDGTNGAQNNTFVDSSSNNFTITRNGNVTQGSFSPFPLNGATYNPAVHGGSGYFDGTGDYLSIADNAAFAIGSSEFTLELWAYPTTVGTRQIFFSQTSGVNTNTSILVEINASSKWVAIVAAASTVYTVTSTNNAVANAWTHVCCERSGDTFTLYVNGVSVATEDLTGVTVNNSTAPINISGYDNGGTLLISNGYASNVRLVIGDAVYTTGFTPPTASLTAVTNTSLLLNFTNAGIFDNTGKNNLETVGNAQIDTTTKKFGTGSMEFDGTGDYLSIADNSAFTVGNGDWTLEFWCWANSSSRQSLYTQTNSAGENVSSSFFTEISSASKWRFAVTSGGASYEIISAQDIITNQWQHLAFVRNSNTATLYLNGSSIGTVDVTGVTVNDSSEDINIGAYGGGVNPFNGYIDDLRFTKGVARYTADFTPPTKAFPDQ